jgi:hypothetical protein
MTRLLGPEAPVRRIVEKSRRHASPTRAGRNRNSHAIAAMMIRVQAGRMNAEDVTVPKVVCLRPPFPEAAQLIADE